MAAIFYGEEYARNRSDIVAGAEAQRRLLQRQGRGPAPAARRDTSRYDRALEASDAAIRQLEHCLLYTSPSPRDATLSRMPSSA